MKMEKAGYCKLDTCLYKQKSPQECSRKITNSYGSFYKACDLNLCSSPYTVALMNPGKESMFKQEKISDALTVLRRTSQYHK